MRARTLSTALVAPLLALPLLLASAAPAAAADDEIVPVLTYSGGLTLVDGEGNTVSVTSRLTVDCTEEPCTALAEITDGPYIASPSNGQALPLTNGALSEALPEFGDLCALRWIGAGVLDLVVTATEATLRRTSGAGSASCSDGAEATAGSAVISGVLAYVAGSVCLLDASCPEPKDPAELRASRTVPDSPIADLLPDEPGTLSELPTPRFTLGTAAWAAGGAVVLVLLVALPSTLLDSATERWSERVSERRARRGRPPKDPTRAPLSVVGWPLATLGLLVAAALSALVDPGVGWDLAGLRVALAMAASFLVTVALGWILVAVVVRIGNPDSRPRAEFRPLTLLVVAGAVLFSRLTAVEPGVVFGVVGGVAFAGALAAAPRGRAALLSMLWALLTGVGAWIGYEALVAVQPAEPDWLGVLARESLSAIAITGVSILPIALLPIRGMPGRDVWRWNRWLWAVTYLVGSAAFLLALLPLPESWDAIGTEVWVWAAAFAAYAVVAVVVWLLVVRPWRPEPVPDSAPPPSG